MFHVSFSLSCDISFLHYRMHPLPADPIFACEFGLRVAFRVPCPDLVVPFPFLLLHGKFDNLPLRTRFGFGNPFCRAKRIWLTKIFQFLSSPSGFAVAIRFFEGHAHSKNTRNVFADIAIDPAERNVEFDCNILRTGSACLRWRTFSLRCSGSIVAFRRRMTNK